MVSVVTRYIHKVKPFAVVPHADEISAGVLISGDPDSPAAVHGGYSVSQRVLHQRLHGERRQEKVHRLYIVDKIDLTLETYLFYIKVILYVRQLLFKGDQLFGGELVHVTAQVL